VLIVVSDATRATGSAQIVNLLVRRLISERYRARRDCDHLCHGYSPAGAAGPKSRTAHPFIAHAFARSITTLTIFSTNQLGTMEDERHQGQPGAAGIH